MSVFACKCKSLISHYLIFSVRITFKIVPCHCQSIAWSLRCHLMLCDIKMLSHNAEMPSHDVIFQNLIPKFLLLISAILVNIFGGLFALLTKEVFISAVFSYLFAQLQFFSSQIRVKVFSVTMICNQLVHIHHLVYSFPCECNTFSFLFLWKVYIAITCSMIPLHCKLVLMSWSSDRMVKKMVDAFSWLWEFKL